MIITITMINVINLDDYSVIMDIVMMRGRSINDMRAFASITSAPRGPRKPPRGRGTITDAPASSLEACDAMVEHERATGGTSVESLRIIAKLRCSLEIAW